ncbi:DUF1905 domain-containing protein [Spirosoma sp.]|uniref:DUF1905 domain-containing protein n=1 Tax=Spirosoma sp. TaxID=1899569 RepID=UPI00262BF42D|nr:DUF1905 domain-containing protein [Spirosoma sp.]MCX6213525.1 DUF1905 domain-containing protein [Spirosoma sp.]
MDYLVKDEKLELKYESGKGAWTYHIQIPNTKHIAGKWGDLKVSGYIDEYKLETKNLFTITGQDKLISINQEIRSAINKTGGDTVTVTLYLLNIKEQITEEQVLDTFKEADVLKSFEKMPEEERHEILKKILSQRSEEKQVKMIINHIDKLTK